MRITPTALPEVKLILPEVHGDERGFFAETYNCRRFVQAGIRELFVQDNHSRSCARTLRGLHYQLQPGQAKLVRVIAGAIFDVAVDIRRHSPTFGQWVSQELSAASHAMLYVPVGFAHGFCVLSESAEVEYKVDEYYDPAKERGIRYDDPAIGVAWPVRDPILSARDRSLPPLAEAETDFHWRPPT